jgi:predicted GNAT family acetyltransferase
MEILHEIDGSKGAFRIRENGKVAAEMTYSRAGEKLMIIDHTEISPALQGQGVGRKLLQMAVDFARSNGIKILPLCPYAKSVFDKDPDIRDVLR